MSPEEMIENYVQNLEKLVQNKDLFTNDIVFQTTLFIVFVNKEFDKCVDNRSKQNYADEFIKCYEQREGQLQDVQKEVARREKIGKVQQVDPESLSKMLQTMEDEYDRLKRNLSMCGLKEESKLDGLRKMRGRFC